MPFYEYQCTKCGHVEEVLQKSDDAPLKKCPACGKSAMKKMVSAAAFRLKGGGWYETDFKSGNKKNVAGDSGSETKADAKSETKPAAAPAKVPAKAANKKAAISMSKNKKVKS